MKSRIIFVVLLFVFFGCDNNQENVVFKKDKCKELEFAEDIDSFGKSVAKNIRIITKKIYLDDSFVSLDKQKIKYSIEKNYVKLLDSNEVNVKKYSSIYSDKKALVDIFISLTPIQKKVLIEISKKTRASKSFDEFVNYLYEINDFVKNNVSEIEQKRLLMVISASYYGMQEIQKLKSEGYLPRKSLNLGIPQLRSTEEEPTSGDIKDWCGLGLTEVWLWAWVEPSPVGELIATGVTLIYAGRLLYQYYVTCSIDVGSGETDTDGALTRDECIDMYADNCISGPCDVCLQYCIAQGEEDSRCTYQY